ncbi:MAG: carbohydrate kinase [Thermoanaerobaculia bacterium]|nr:carbohydrate kinase [Thermoanaerobaculia bacterium]
MRLLGLDIGSSSIKAALVDARSGKTLGAVQAPDREMEILAPKPDWAEQDPEVWWQNTVLAVQKLLRQTQTGPGEIAAIGISYQMHGLVALDDLGKAVRPSIIWCDSRAVATGDSAFRALGESYCLTHFLNSPGNFTASKLKWVKDNEPERFARIRYAMLPGDYIAYRLTGVPATTVSGLSEGVMWDFAADDIAHTLLGHYGIDKALIPPLVPAFGLQGRLTETAAGLLGLKTGTPVTYRAGDQPNNALALHVLKPGEVAATGGTSGVVYGVVDKLVADPQNRVNSFAHVNHQPGAPRIGVLLCINGSGIQYSWMRKQVAGDAVTYPEMEQLAATAPPGADGLCILPFGNGAERMLGNRTPGAQIGNLHFNRHGRAHLYRAALEGVAFSFVYGMQVLKTLGLDVSVIRVGNDNLFRSAIFSHTIAQLMNCRIEMLQTTGAVGAAIASGVGIGLWKDAGEGLGALEVERTYEPGTSDGLCREAYERWVDLLGRALEATFS